MKKILTVSLFAIMAVSAANAEIASTQYVTDRTGSVSFTEDGYAKGKTNLTEAIAAIDAGVNSLGGTIAPQIEAALVPVNESMDELGGRVATAESDIYAIENSDYAKSGITATKVSTYDGYAATIAANTAAAGAAQSAADAAQGEVDALETVVANNKTAAESALSTAVSTLEGKISDAQTAATYDDTEVRGLITANANDINAIETSAYATSGVNADVVAKANSAMQEASLKALSSYTENGCGTMGVMCSLVSDGGTISWEVVNQGK